MTRGLLACGVLMLASCGAGAIDEDGSAVDESSLQTGLILQFLNGPDATVSVLDNDVGLDTRAAKAIVAHVRGPDGVLGTADDNPFDSIAELDAVSYVGAAAITAIDKYAVAKYGTTPTPTPTPTPTGQPVTIESVTFTPAQAAGVLDLINNHWEENIYKVGLSSLAFTSLNAGRPFASIQAVAAAASVGTVALTKLRDWVQNNVINPGGDPPPAPDANGCIATGGTYDTVAFTKSEECHAVDFINKARFSEMGALPDRGRLVAYTGSAKNADGTRSWKTMKEYSDTSLIGTTAVKAVKDAAATWTANGLAYDTIASTWTNRAKLLDKPVFFNRVYVTRLLGNINGDDCAELRDSPAAANYLVNCIPTWVIDGAAAWTEGASIWVVQDGMLRTSTMASTGGYRLMSSRPAGKLGQ